MRYEGNCPSLIISPGEGTLGSLSCKFMRTFERRLPACEGCLPLLETELPKSLRWSVNSFSNAKKHPYAWSPPVAGRRLLLLRPEETLRWSEREEMGFDRARVCHRQSSRLLVPLRAILMILTVMVVRSSGPEPWQLCFMLRASRRRRDFHGTRDFFRDVEGMT